VQDLGTGGEGAIVRAITAMAGALGLEVVAEGVETAAQAAEARALGCARAQGYFYARPAPAAAIEALFPPGLRAPAHALR
jgi:EAL domain-containing protein (putative c-di-GMP-specific phosphodiesterase class I)